MARLGTSLAFTLLALLLAPAAALVCGVTVFVVACLVALIGRLVVRGRPATPFASSAPSGIIGGAPPGVAAAIGTELGAAGSAWMKGHRPQVVLSAAAVGFLLGVSPRLRAALWRLLR